MTFAPKKGRWAAVAVTGAVMASLAFGASVASATTTTDERQTPAAAAPAATTFTISGKLLDVPADADRIAVWVLNKDGVFSRATVNADRTFVSEPMPAGDYVISASYFTKTESGKDEVAWSGAGTASVSAAPVTGVDISFLGSGAIAGHVDGPVETDVQMNLYSWSGSEWVHTWMESGWGDYKLGYYAPSASSETGLFFGPAVNSIVSFTDPSEDSVAPETLEPGVVEPTTADYPYCTMYFSDALDYQNAEEITVEVGTTTVGIDQTLKLKSEGCENTQAVIIPQDVTIQGEAVVGQTLTATTGTWEPAPVELSYQWYVNGNPVAAPAAAKAAAPVDAPSESLAKSTTSAAPTAADAAPTAATGNTFQVLPEYLGATIEVEVTGSRPDADSVMRSATVGPVTEAPAVALTLDLPETVVAGEVAEFVTGGWAAGEALTAELILPDGSVIETGAFSADENGVFHGTFSPGVGDEGVYTIRISGASGSIEGVITVVPAGTNPPVEPTDPPVEPTEPPVEPTPAPVDPTTPPGNGGGTAPGELAKTGVDAPLGIGLVGVGLLAAGLIGLRRRSA